MSEFGVITEQGDLGLGFNPLTQEDQKVVNEAVKREKDMLDNKTQVITEKK